SKRPGLVRRYVPPLALRLGPTDAHRDVLPVSIDVAAVAAHDVVPFDVGLGLVGLAAADEDDGASEHALTLVREEGDHDALGVVDRVAVALDLPLAGARNVERRLALERGLGR